jgi:hypothetical protein
MSFFISAYADDAGLISSGSRDDGGNLGGGSQSRATSATGEKTVVAAVE